MGENPIELFNTVIWCRKRNLARTESYYRAGTMAGAYIMMLAGVSVAYGLAGDSSEFLNLLWPMQ